MLFPKTKKKEMAKGNRTTVNIDQTFLTTKHPFHESSSSSSSSHHPHHNAQNQIITSGKYKNNKRYRFDDIEQSIVAGGVDDLIGEPYSQQQDSTTLMANKLLSVSSLPVRNGINYSSMNGTFRKYQSDLQPVKMTVTKTTTPLQLSTNKQPAIISSSSLNESPQSGKSTTTTLVVPTSTSTSTSHVQMTSGQISNTSTSNQTATTSISLPSVSAQVGQQQRGQNHHGQNYLKNISLAMMMPNNLAGNQQQQQQHKLHNQPQQNKNKQQQQQPLLNSLSMLESSSSTLHQQQQQQQQHQPTVTSQQMLNNNNGSHHHQPHNHQMHHHSQHQYYESSPIMLDNDDDDNHIHSKSNPNYNQLSPSSIFCVGNSYRLNGIGELLASLALMCILSLLMAFLALSFIQRSYSISQLSANNVILPNEQPINVYNNNSKQSRFFHTNTNVNTNGNGQFNQKIVANAKEYIKVFQISISLSTLTIALDLCCLFVCCIQFLSIIKLLKTPFGVRRLVFCFCLIIISQ